MGTAAGLGAHFLGYGPSIEPLVGRLGDGLASAGAPSAELAAVVFTHLHQDHARGATWSGELSAYSPNTMRNHRLFPALITSPLDSG